MCEICMYVLLIKSFYIKVISFDDKLSIIFQLVCQTYMYQTSQLLLEVSERSLLHTLVCVHKAHKILAQRMLYFREMNKVWHECSSVIQEIRDNEPDNFMCKEEELVSLIIFK